MTSNSKIISIHIPKTAGTSFRMTLSDVYGEKLLPWYDNKNEHFKVPEQVEIIHGHINAHAILKLQENNSQWKDAMFIIWIREPVARFISNYFYLREIIVNKIKDELDLDQRMLKTFEEYLNQDTESNRMKNYFDPALLSVENLIFIGNSDSYSEDLHRLAHLLNWKTYKVFQENRTQKKESIPNSAQEKVKLKNTEDLMWYETMQSLSNDLKRKFVASGEEPIIIQASDSQPFLNRIWGRLFPKKNAIYTRI